MLQMGALNMTNIAIIFHSRSGNTYQLAAAAATAAAEEGADVQLRKVPELPDTMIADKQAYAELAADTAEIPDAGLDDLDRADAIMIGTPVHFGLPAPQITNFIDHTGPIAIPGKLMNKAVSVFASGSMPHAGQQATILAVHNSVCHWGSVIVPTGSSAEILFEANNGAPYGASSVSRHEPYNVHDDNLGAVRYQARRTLEIATALKKGLDAESSTRYVDPDRLRRFGMDNLEWAWGWGR